MKSQQSDPAISQVIKLKETGNTLTGDLRRGISGLAMKLLHEWEKLRLKDGLLYRQTSQRSQLVLPEQYQLTVLKYRDRKSPGPNSRPILLTLYETGC